jgi:hypothetical protein
MIRNPKQPECGDPTANSTKKAENCAWRLYFDRNTPLGYINPDSRRSGRAVECAGFENRLAERLQGFESLLLRCYATVSDLSGGGRRSGPRVRLAYLLHKLEQRAADEWPGSRRCVRSERVPRSLFNSTCSTIKAAKNHASFF